MQVVEALAVGNRVSQLVEVEMFVLVDLELKALEIGVLSKERPAIEEGISKHSLLALVPQLSSQEALLSFA